MEQENIYTINPVVITKWLMLCIIAVLVSVIIGCTTSTDKMLTVENALTSELQAEIERFEQTKGISCIDIPNIYDISNMKVGSVVKFKYKDDTDTTTYTTKELKSIHDSNNGRQYQVLEIFGDDLFRTVKYINTLNESKIICNDAEIGDKFKLRVIRSKLEYVEDSDLVNQFFFDWLLQGPTVAMGNIHINAAEQKRTNKEIREIEDSLTKLAKSMEEDAEVEERKTKIVDFKFISQNDLIISGRPIHCKVYQVDTVTQLKVPSLDNDEMHYYGSARINIINTSKRLWVSDEVPFGIVKSENKSSTIGPYKESVIRIPLNNVIEAIEFKY